jgi:integrase
VFSQFSRNPKKITQEMNKVCKAAGIEGLRFHDLRHEATSRLFENTDLDIMEIRSITGHKTLQMLVRYTHLRTARLANRLAGAKKQAS